MSVVITIPIYREKLSMTEIVSLQQMRRVLGQYPCVFIAPESLEFDYEGLEDGIAVERFADSWFTSITNYSRLLLTEDYYARFSGFDYMLIYQLDAFVFEDRLQAFCNLGYDYIGAPISPYHPTWHAIGARVGNGGLSLRKIVAAHRALRQWGKLPQERQLPFQDIFLFLEDSFWGWCGVQEDFDFQCAPVKVALQFSVQDEVQCCYRRIADGTLRLFGCHGWNKTRPEFWCKQIEACGYDLSAWQAQGEESRRQTDLQNYCQKRRYIDLQMLWGALRKHKYTSMTILLMKWLERYPAGDITWEGLGEELQYLWRRCRLERIEHPVAEIELERLEQVLDEALCRTLQAGSGQEYLTLLLESLLPQIQQAQTMSAAKLGKMIEDIRWQEWEEKAVYAKPVPLSVKKKHIVAISMVKNEMDIIESFVRHTLTFADELLIIDHQSSDNTSDILTALQQEGLPITVHTGYRVEYAQAEMTTELMYDAINKHGADIVIPLDADEFLVGTTVGKSIRELLEELDDNNVYELPWRRFIPYQPNIRRENFMLSRPALGDVYRDSGQKCIIGAHCVVDYKLKLIQGNHYLYAESDGQKAIMAMQKCLTLEIAHFYWRSQEQFQNKIFVGWPNIVARYSMAALGGGGYRNYHRRMIQGEHINPLEFLQQGSLMDLRPFVERQTLRYSQHTTPKPMENLMQASVLLAERVAELEMLSHTVVITTVVPYLGSLTDCLRRLQQAEEQDYTCQQVLIPCITQPDKTVMLQLKESCQDIFHNKIDWQILEKSAEQDVFSQLEYTAQGDFVHWHLPGTEVAHNFLTRMVVGMVNQPHSFSIMISDGQEDYRNELPYITIHPLENVQAAKSDAFWQRLLEIGKYPAGDITAALIKREVMDVCDWLRQSFLLPEGLRLPFLSWKILSSACNDSLISVITDCYAWPKGTEMSLENLVMHQLEWWNLLQLEKDSWNDEAWYEVVKLFCRNGETILRRGLDSGCNTNMTLWQQYQQVLLQSSKML